ncbi:MAG: hypothetical protein V4517_14925 [Pseudomonadota bacterium]
MPHSNQGNISGTAPPPGKRRTPPSEQTNEPRSLIEQERVDVEREAPLDEGQSIERSDPDGEVDPPVFEE